MPAYCTAISHPEKGTIRPLSSNDRSYRGDRASWLGFSGLLGSVDFATGSPFFLQINCFDFTGKLVFWVCGPIELKDAVVLFRYKLGHRSAVSLLLFMENSGLEPLTPTMPL